MDCLTDGLWKLFFDFIFLVVHQTEMLQWGLPYQKLYPPVISCCLTCIKQSLIINVVYDRYYGSLRDARQNGEFGKL